MTKFKYVKLRPSTLTIDPRFQRDLDEGRAKAISKNIDLARIGVLEVAARDDEDETNVVIDGQHRVAGMKLAEFDEPILCKVHYGLSLADEAALFLKLNGGRSAVRVFDKFKARLVAGDAEAHEIKRIVSSLGLRITRSAGPKSVAAIQALEHVHRRTGRLRDVLWVLASWAEGDHNAFDRLLIKDVSFFLGAFPDAIDLDRLVKKLEPHSPSRVLNRIKRAKDDGITCEDAAVSEFMRIYNHRERVKLRRAAIADAAE